MGLEGHLIVRILSVGLLLVLIVATIGLVPSVRADLPPPTYSAWTNSGGPITLASNVTLPEVRVNATIDLTGSWTYDINVTCSFTIESLVSQNLTTAFVYPEIWAVMDPSQQVTMQEFSIWVNDTSIAFIVFNFDEFKSKYDLNQTDWWYVRDCSFALFNFSVYEENPTIVTVTTRFRSSSTGHNFIFDYIVETARRWEGNTHEIIKIKFQRANQTEIIEYRYEPLNDFVFAGNDYSADVTWDFTIQEFSYDRVRFLVQQKEYPKYHDLQQYWILFIFNIATVSIIVLIATALIWRKLKIN